MRQLRLFLFLFFTTLTWASIGLAAAPVCAKVHLEVSKKESLRNNNIGNFWSNAQKTYEKWNQWVAISNRGKNPLFKTNETAVVREMIRMLNSNRSHADASLWPIFDRYLKMGESLIEQDVPYLSLIEFSKAVSILNTKIYHTMDREFVQDHITEDAGYIMRFTQDLLAKGGFVEIRTTASAWSAFSSRTHVPLFPVEVRVEGEQRAHSEEFTQHDFGHTNLTSVATGIEIPFQAQQRTFAEVILLVEQRHLQFQQFIKTLDRQNPSLYSAVQKILFTIAHEEGFVSIKEAAQNGSMLRRFVSRDGDNYFDVGDNHLIPAQGALEALKYLGQYFPW